MAPTSLWPGSEPDFWLGVTAFQNLTSTQWKTFWGPAPTGGEAKLGSWSKGGAQQEESTTSINTSIALLSVATENLRAQSKNIATSLNIVTVRQDFTKDMIDTLKTGSDNLVLADMNEEGANMLMLQTRRSLGTTSLTLASQAAQAVLRLFEDTNPLLNY